jgi:hypothetical protein
MAKMKTRKSTVEAILQNVGLIDVVTGTFIKGAKGEMVLAGGIDNVYAIIGPGNSYKSTLLHYFTTTAADRMAASLPRHKNEKVIISSFDTEMNMKYARLYEFLLRAKHLKNDMLDGDDPDWNVLTKADCPADIWVSDFRDYVLERAKEKKIEFAAFENPYTKKPYVAHFPGYSQIDSIAEFETSAGMEMLAKSKLDRTDTATYYLGGGLFKSKFIGELPRLTRMSNLFLGYVAHTGEGKGIGENKYVPPEKQNQYLKGDTKIKGATGKTNYLTLLSMYASTASVLKNKATRLPEYPRQDMEEYETDLNVVRLTLLRSKSGPSGTVTEVVVSQSEGVKPELSAFHYIKNQAKYGIIGNDRNYAIALRPNVSLRRTNIRELLETDVRLARAVTILERLRKMQLYMPMYNKYQLSPEELYERLIEHGYEWDTLLLSRDWWTIDQYSPNVVPYLSELDLLRMAHDVYVPYWLEEDRKTVKKTWRHHFLIDTPKKDKQNDTI